MFRAPADPAVFQRYFVRQVVWPIGAAVAIVLIAACFGLYWSSNKSDEVALARETQAVQMALVETAEQLSYEQQSVATWDQLARKVREIPIDKDWLDIEIGQWLNDGFRHDLILILSPRDEPIYVFADGKQKPDQYFDGIRDNLRSRIDAVRHSARAIDRNHNGSVPIHTHSRIRAGTVFTTSLTRINGRPAIVSVMAIGKNAAASAPLIVSVRYFNGPVLQRIAALGQVEALRYAATPDRRPGETMITMRDHDTQMGYLFWKPTRPGLQTLFILGPVSAGAIALLVGIMAMLVRSLWRSGRQLANAVVDLQASEKQAQHLAFHDVLTGLPNRALFQDRMDQALARARRGHPCAILALDLDRFKQVNDMLGHAAGDTLIREFANRLNGLVRNADTLARLGGDEFSIVLCDIERQSDVEALCERVLAAVREPFNLLGSEVFVGVSIGVALVPEAGFDRGDLLRKADIALYRAKSEGRDRYRIFTPSMDETVKLRAELEEDLRRAIAKGDEIQVYYQTEVGSDGKQIVGLEALLRWQHPTRGMISPEQFIPIAEETGLARRLITRCTRVERR